MEAAGSPEASATYDAFLSYPHVDAMATRHLRDALTAAGQTAWLDEQQIETFASISETIRRGLGRSRVLVAYYSRSYLTQRACQWELTVALLADPSRVLVVNPDEGVDHIVPSRLRDAVVATAPMSGDVAAHAALAGRIAEHVAATTGVFGELVVPARPRWCGRRAVDAARFVGRGEALWQIHSALDVETGGMIAGGYGDPVLMVVGLGGIGKSLVVEEYALRFGSVYPGGVFWLRAGGDADAAGSDHRRELDAQLRDLAIEYGVEVRGLDATMVRATFARRLDEAGERFLWIVDDLPDGLDRDALEPWLAPGRWGRTLLTTRSQGYTAIGSRAIDIGVLSDREGLELLRKHREPDDPAEEAAAAGLVDDLGRHALAIDVCGAAMAVEQGLRTFAEYREALASSTTDELELAADLADALPNGHERSIATTLRRSIDRLDEPALDFLRLAALLSREPIEASHVVAMFGLADDLDPGGARTRATTGMKGAVRRSLANQQGTTRTVHALVSRTMLLRDGASERVVVLRVAAIDALTTILSAADEIAAEESVLAHARRLAEPPSDLPRARLLQTVAFHDSLRGDERSAVDVRRRVLATFQAELGDDDPETLTAKGYLAMTLRALSDYAGARGLFEEVVAGRTAVLGDEHPHTLAALGNLGDALTAEDRPREGRVLLERASAGARRVLGDDHPETLRALNNLAETMRSLGDLAGACDLHAELLSTRRRTLGDEHLDTVGSMINLASGLRARGDLVASRGLDDEALITLTARLGEEHPTTLSSMNNIAESLRKRGEYEAAKNLHERVLAGRRRLFGDEHHDTMGSLNNIALTRSALGDHDGAAVAWDEVVSTLRRVLGGQHRDTVGAMTNYAAALWEQGEYMRARPLLERIYRAYRSGRDDADPVAVEAARSLVAALRATGDERGARGIALRHGLA